MTDSRPARERFATQTHQLFGRVGDVALTVEDYDAAMDLIDTLTDGSRLAARLLQLEAENATLRLAERTLSVDVESLRAELRSLRAAVAKAERDWADAPAHDYDGDTERAVLSELCDLVPADGSWLAGSTTETGSAW